VPPYLRRTERLDELIPWLYLKGVSTIPVVGNNGDLARVNGAAPVQKNSGNLGIAELNPGAPLHIRSLNGTSKVLAEDDVIPASLAFPQTMFELRLPGAVHFDLVDQNFGGHITAVPQTINKKAWHRLCLVKYVCASI
jgi:hypothetical protein